ncbi:hypothetical protein [Sinorhizobium meliloti]|nr:hypothetical protein U8C39_29050 [Sinorhizobium meliloti]WQP19183.1 hypothetical protein U8C33_29465 [Sinorhizobium meliloti]WQP32671.1 hypothetical protein U8C45_29005 [Sinorhizobium meliloti]
MRSVKIDRAMGFNAHGPEGLINGKAPGLPSRFKPHRKIYENIVAHCCDARRKLQSQPRRMMSIGQRMGK